MARKTSRTKTAVSTAKAALPTVTQLEEFRATAERVAHSVAELGALSMVVASDRAVGLLPAEVEQDTLVDARKTMTDVQASVRASLRELDRLLPNLHVQTSDFADDLAEALGRTVRNRLIHSGSAIRQFGDPEQLAQRWAAMLPLTPSPMEELTGPFYDTAGLRSWLGITRQALDSRARNGTLLALVTGGGQRVYPAWQWRSDRKTIPHLAQALRPLLAGARDAWTVALWMTAPVDHGDGREIAAWKWLDEGNDPEPVVSEARADAARWAS